MVDADDKVVIIDTNGYDAVLFQITGSNWSRENAGDFNDAIAELGSIEVSGQLESDILTFTVGGVDYSYNTTSSVITPDLEVE